MDSYQATKELSHANREFYHCFERLDLEGMRALWLDEQRISCIHPDGQPLFGPLHVMASWQTIFRITERIRFELVDLAVEIVGDVGWVACIERIRTSGGDAVPAGEGNEIVVEASATNLYLLKDGRWRMLLHHASPIQRRFVEG